VVHAFVIFSGVMKRLRDTTLVFFRGCEAAG